MNNIYKYNEISYAKGYELGEEDIYNAMDKKTTSLAKSKEALDSFINCVKVHNKINNIEINDEEFNEVCSSCLLVEGSVFGIDIDYEELFNTYKNMPLDDFLKYLYNVREAISLCMLNEIGKKRTELEYALTMSPETTKKFEKFKENMEELFSIKNSENKTYMNIDSFLDEYINNNLLNLQKNIISGNPLQVTEDMLNKAKQC